MAKFGQIPIWVGYLLGLSVQIGIGKRTKGKTDGQIAHNQPQPAREHSQNPPPAPPPLHPFTMPSVQPRPSTSELREQTQARLVDLFGRDAGLQFLGWLFTLHGFEIRVVGGAVRDTALAILRGINVEIHDIDISSTSTPEQTIAILKSANIRVVLTGLQHGTVTAVIDGEEYEVTTTRVETGNDGRHAEVQWVSSHERDSERRDLVFNALSANFLTGEVHDYHGGLESLILGQVRTVGNAVDRFTEDFLRILRAYRFHGRIAGESGVFLPELVDAISATSHGLAQISGERIRSEIFRIIQENPWVLHYLHAHGVLAVIGFPDVEAEQVARAVEIASPVTGETAEALVSVSVAVLSALVSSAEHAEDIVSRWRLSRQEAATLRFIVTQRSHALSLRWAQAQIIEASPQRSHIVAGQVTELLRASGHRETIAELHSRWSPEGSWNIPQFPINAGHVRLSRSGIEGRRIGEVIRRLRAAWLESGFSLGIVRLIGLI